MPKEQINIRAVDRELWHKFRVAALQRNLTMAKALHEAIALWLQREEVA